MSSCVSNWLIVYLQYRFFPLRYRFMHFFLQFFMPIFLLLSWIALFAFNIRAKEWVMQTTADDVSCEQTAAYYSVTIYTQTHTHMERDWTLVVIFCPWVYWNFYQRLQTCVVMIGASKILSIFFDLFLFLFLFHFFSLFYSVVQISPVLFI